MYCTPAEHVSRRAFLKGTLLTTSGALMNWGSLSGSRTSAAETARSDKRCIFLFMNGGCSQFETFDLKPGRPTGGPFRPIQTNVPGTVISEYLPHLAQHMDKVAVVRSMKTSQIDHPGGIYLMHCGYAPTANVRYPEIGAVCAKYLGHEKAELPGFIKISSVGYAGAGFLGAKYMPLGIDHTGRLPQFAVSNQSPQIEARRAELRDFVERQFAQDSKAETSRIHHEAFEAARRLQGARQVFDIEKEWEKYRDRYGDSVFGKQCLLARRLVEAGVPFVEVGQSSYDTHADNFTGHKGMLPCMEQAWAALMVDLQERGLFQNTLIIWMGEIGRTPSINNRIGRDHYVRAWTACLAGGLVRGGTVYGSTDEDGRDVQENPVSEGDFFATIYQALGINPKKEHYLGLRPIPLAPFGSRIVKEILA